MLTEYTTYADIRALIGTNDEEIDDTTLGLEVYSLSLTGELEDIDLTLPSQYKSIADTSTRTTSEQRLFDAVRLFAPYAVANQLVSSLPMFAPKEISDGKALLTRFTDNPYKATILEVARQYERTKGRLIAAFGELNASTAAVVTVNIFAVSSPDTDPVIE